MCLPFEQRQDTLEPGERILEKDSNERRETNLLDERHPDPVLGNEIRSKSNVAMAKFGRQLLKNKKDIVNTNRNAQQGKSLNLRMLGRGRLSTRGRLPS